MHVEQYLPSKSAEGYSTFLFKFLVVAMSIALAATLAIGVLLAFHVQKSRWQVWISLMLGVIVPVAILWMGQKH